MNFERKRDVVSERDRLRVEVAEKARVIYALQAKLNGERHETGTQCNGCVNLLRGKTWWNGAEIEERMCKLDVKCKDRKESNL